MQLEALVTVLRFRWCADSDVYSVQTDEEIQGPLYLVCQQDGPGGR